LTAAPALVLFDIDGTILRRAGPHHREALVEAVRRVAGIETTTSGIPLQGMLDTDILHLMLQRAGIGSAQVRRWMPDLKWEAERYFVKVCPDLREKVCPGVRELLRDLRRQKIPAGLVTGNLSRIAWKKMERSGLKMYFRFGAFSEQAPDRAGLVRRAIRHARREGWISSTSAITFIGDHENDIRAAQASGIRSVAVATGLSSAEALASCGPDILVNDLRSLQLEMLIL
jgi:phosphoglycolate phosphatase-like HAD superfamily hydrolase